MRVTLSMLQNRVRFLNKKMNRPETYFNSAEDRKINAGHFRIDCAYGGYRLEETCNDAGGVINVFNIGHIPARELMNLIYAFETGVRYTEENKE